MTIRRAISHTLLLRDGMRSVRPEECGGKGWNLLRLRRLGFPVPPFVILPAEVFAQCSAPVRDEIDTMLATLEDADSTSRREERIAAASRRLRRIVRELPLSEPAVRALHEGFSEAAGPDQLVSVRSSVAGEDGREHSFAGQMDSVLNVSEANLPDALRAVWASAFSERALAYRLQAGLPLRGIRIAVVLQRMVQAEAAGVLFTRDPVTGAHVCVITAGYGLGEGVVSDSVECDTYRCALEGTDIQRVVAEKTRRMQRPENGRSGVRTTAVPEELRGIPVLNDTEILVLRDWAVRLESALKAPVDVEWARSGDGALQLLQVRPITAAAARTNEMEVWDNANIVESYPGLTLPLTFSFIQQAYEQAFRRALRGFHLRSAPTRQMDHALSNLLGLLRGRVYYNLRNWYGMLSLLPGFKRHKKAWDQMIGIAQSIDIPQARLSRFDRAAAAVLSLWRLLRIRGNARRFHEEFDVLYREAAAYEFAHTNAGELVHFYNELATRAPRFWPRTLYNDFAAMTWYDALKRLCRRWNCRDGLHNELLCAEPGIESVRPVRALVAMAAHIRLVPEYAVLFDDKDDAAVFARISSEPAFDSLRSFLDEYLVLYGDRGFEELKLESHTYRDDPAALIGVLRNYIASGLSVAQMETDEHRTRERAEQEFARTLCSIPQRLIARIVLDRARAAVAARENMRFARSRFYGVIRTLFRRMGRLLAEQGIIDRDDDIHYLRVEEIFILALGISEAPDPRTVVAQRRSEYLDAAKHQPPSRFTTAGVPDWSQVPELRTESDTAADLRGTGCSAGTVTAPALLVHDPRQAGDTHGRILVARSTDPGWVFLMINAAGLVVEQGSVLSHTAIIGRELGIPTIVAAAGAMTRIPDGVVVTMNGSTGELLWK